MPSKRTNKTARVLNLIAGSAQEPGGQEETSEQPLPAPETAMPEQAETSSIPQADAPQPQQTDRPLDDETASAEKSAPDTAQSSVQAASPAPEATTLPPAPQPVVPIVQTVLEKEQAISEEIRRNLTEVYEAEHPTLPAPESAADESAEADAADEPSDAPQEDATPAAEQPPAMPEEPPAFFTPAGERNVHYVNVLQELVESNAPYYINTMLQCNCPRCVADMKALALTNLPSKYVVLNPAQKSAYMSVYESRYQSLLSVQMTRACVIVNDKPHH